MSRNEEEKRSSNIPEYNPSKAMDSKREVEQSPDEKTDQDFPGYPHYPASEDIMDQRSGAHRVDADLENLGTGPNATGVNQRFLAGQNISRAEEMKSLVTSSDDEGQDSLTALDAANAEIGTPQNVSNEDRNTNTDIAGTDLEEENRPQD